MERWEFLVLGIPVTKDKSKIKKAYAELVKHYHPEEFPKEWERIHEAYTAAIRYAEGVKTYEWNIENMEFESVQEEAKSDEQEAELFDLGEERAESESYDEIFWKIESKEDDGKEKVRALKKKLYALKNLRGRSEYLRWQEFLLSKEMEEAPAEVLQALLRQIRIYKPKKRTRRFIAKIMADREQEYLVSMHLLEAKTAKEIKEYCTAKRTSDERNIIALLAFTCMVLILFIIAPSEDSTGEIEVLVADYMSQKYQKDYDLQKFDAERRRDGKSLRGYYCVRIMGEGFVYAYRDKSDSDTFIFRDTIQMDEIMSDVKERIAQSEYHAMFVTTDMEAAGTYYDGDLKEFFQKEAELERKIAGVSDKTYIESMFTIMEADPDIQVMKEYGEGEAKEAGIQWKAEMKELEKILGPRIVGILYTKEYMEDLSTKIIDSNKDGWEERHLWSRSSSPIPDPFIIALYVSSGIEDDSPLVEGDNCGLIKGYPRKFYQEEKELQ